MKEFVRDILCLIGFVVVMAVTTIVVGLFGCVSSDQPRAEIRYQTKVERVSVPAQCIVAPPPDEPKRDCDSIGALECDDIMTARYADAYRGLKLWVDAYVWPACRDLR